MTRLVDETLRGPLFSRPAGLASTDVTLADPTMGTGSFLLGVMRKIAATIEADQGKGAVRDAIEAAMSRLIGVELQFGPFAVAQLRLIAELQALTKPDDTRPPKLPDLQLFVTDTLGNAYIEEAMQASLTDFLVASRWAVVLPCLARLLGRPSKAIWLCPKVL
ncbi:hypothetical protein CK215_29490 [Mesorhizobium sp. WSM3864]|uniref:hypothetical protein n=1 Tax=Mesorhizobium sp. WSM3864 TaxID=2029404 RepID=UPI000BCD1039|nr:hypothetical protein [Mesorhizobium sp. WSM3864]PBB89096.1 hypothetical protein CK215_29490 [Mesorhizobium sp. WSM3864]